MPVPWGGWSAASRAICTIPQRAERIPPRLFTSAALASILGALQLIAPTAHWRHTGGAERAFRWKVPMDDLNDPRISAYRPQRRWLIPAPPGPRPRQNKAQREREARAEARATRLHLVGLTDAAVIVMCLVLGAVVFLFVISHH